VESRGEIWDTISSADHSLRSVNEFTSPCYRHIIYRLPWPQAETGNLYSNAAFKKRLGGLRSAVMNIILSSRKRYTDPVTNNSTVFSVNLYEQQKRAVFTLNVMSVIWTPTENLISPYSSPKYKQVFRCATSRTVPGSIPGGVTGDFFRGIPDRTMCPEVDSASESEYQGVLLG